jgi:hypothetical protein
MAFTASPQQLEFLRQAVDDYCREYGISDADASLYVAELVSLLFEYGRVRHTQLRLGRHIAMADAIKAEPSRLATPARQFR